MALVTVVDGNPPHRSICGCVLTPDGITRYATTPTTPTILTRPNPTNQPIPHRVDNSDLATPTIQASPALTNPTQPCQITPALTVRARPAILTIQPNPTIQARPIHIGDTSPVGIMDQIRANLPPMADRLPGQLAGASDKAALWVNKIPFEITAPPQVRAKPPQFLGPKEDGSPPEPNQWWIPVRLLAPRGDGTFDYQMQDDGEGGRGPVDKILAFDCGQRRNAEMEAIGEYITQRGTAAGPFRLDKGEQRGKGAPPWVIVDWTPAAQPAYASSYQGYQQAAPTVHPTPTLAAPQGQATPPPAAPAPPVVPVPPPPPADLAPPPEPEPEYQYHQRSDGKRFRWRAGMAGWEPDPDSVSAQPLAPTRVVQGYVNSEGMASEQVTTEVADGSRMRQAVYQGDGAVAQPSGVVTQNAVPDGGAAQTAATAAQGAIGVEAQAPAQGAVPSASRPAAATVVPTPAQQPAGAAQTMAGAAAQAYGAGKQVMVSLQCPTCHLEQKGPAFRRPQDGAYVQTHICKSAGKTVVLNATEAVKAAAGVS
jgi:hypothetical protein